MSLQWRRVGADVQGLGWVVVVGKAEDGPRCNRHWAKLGLGVAIVTSEHATRLWPERLFC